ncbi:hypothetical protein [Legionella spiritensis]|uniref:hypothetical protein n=1 Tax=Legionella spiritensis TaxID=452 RepID=UPI000F6FA17E|nr:hypothetical protein [Legionella spiritensis]VEG92069.1 Uncharacterised protein [Legionella spiritensis]
MKIIEHIEGLVATRYSVIRDVLALIKLEAKLARLSVLPLLLTLCFLIVILIITWSLLMLLLGYVFMYFLNDTLLSIVGVLTVNILFFILSLSCLMSNLKKISFAKTREYFATKGQDQS